MLGAGELATLGAWCEARRVRLIVDEIYHGLTYGAPAASILAHAPDAIVVNGFSKYFAMTGWRIGWLVVPPELVRPIELLSQNLFICANTIGQHAALAALRCRPELDRRIEGYRANRAVLLDALAHAGLAGFAPPDGAFYIYVDVGALTDDSARWSRRLLDETGVALTPGADFDQVDGHRYVRLAFCRDRDEIERAADRLVDWLRRS
jgi:aspartate/methionine/tyrosine aminotransferase